MVELKEPAKELRNFIENFDVKTPEIPVVENVYAKIIDDKDNIPELLELHTTKAVRWQQCVEKMINMGVDTFLELGPGGLVSKFINRTSEKMNVNVTTYHIENQESLEDFIKVYREK